MPTFDFIGYTPSQVDSLIERLRPELLPLPFSDDIVFIQRVAQESKVLCLKGGEAPFVRIYTRSEERARTLSELLCKFADIEIVYIAMFTPARKVKSQ